jgi:hypothetical protein
MSGFCKKHNISYGNAGCPDCNRNAAERPYRGMNKPVILDRDVIKYIPARKDTAIQALLTNSNNH